MNKAINRGHWYFDENKIVLLDDEFNFIEEYQL